MQALHSTVVLLKAFAVHNSVAVVHVFTFYCSSIKGWTPARREGGGATLHSTVVLLKGNLAEF